MAKDREQEKWDKLNKPPRQQDPYVTGNRGGYKQGGEVQSGSGGDGGKKDEGCGGEFAAKLPELVIAVFSPTKREELKERARLAWAHQVANGGFPPHAHHLRGLDY